MIVHFVYIKGDSISTPAAITNEVAARLRERYPLKVYDWNERVVIRPEPGDVLIGHPNPAKGPSVFNDSFWQPGWGRRVVFCPYMHGMLEYNGFTDPVVNAADLFLAICGRYWADTCEDSITSHWAHKLVHCDLAVNRSHFPSLKETYNPAGRRRFLYIGHTAAYKATDYLGRLADASPDTHVGWAGQGHIPSARIERHGRVDFSTTAGRELVRSYDFLLTCGRSDANPTTILEAAAWGLVPVATLQSGYYEDDWLVNVPLDDVPAAAAVLARLNACPEAELVARREAGFRQLDAHYNWDRLAGQVASAVEGPTPIEPSGSEWRTRKLQNQAAIRRAIRRAEWAARLTWLRQLPGRAIRKAARVLGRRPSHPS